MQILKKIRKLFNLLILSPFVLKLLIKAFKIPASTGKGSNLCLENGYLALPVNYYSPVPEIKDLAKRRVWDKRSEMRGIDLNINSQQQLLLHIGRSFAEECAWPLLPTENPCDFYLQNQSFSYGCAASTHGIIRYFKPRRVVEIGSGMSSMVISHALGMNAEIDGHPGKYTVVDPYPADCIRKGSLNLQQVLETRVEVIDPSFFDQLNENDILFIDSGHCVRIGGDVNYLFLEIFPRLAPGVIVHIHDISLPYEYPKTYATSETFRQFWTEQYLLQSFLCFNNEFEILLAMNFLMKDYSDVFTQAFPLYNPDIHPFTSGSFWIQRKLLV